jgi:hypothetical protein
VTLFLMLKCTFVYLVLDSVALGPSSSWCAPKIDYKPHIDEPGPNSRIP